MRVLVYTAACLFALVKTGRILLERRSIDISNMQQHHCCPFPFQVSTCRPHRTPPPKCTAAIAAFAFALQRLPPVPSARPCHLIIPWQIDIHVVSVQSDPYRTCCNSKSYFKALFTLHSLHFPLRFSCICCIRYHPPSSGISALHDMCYRNQ